MLRWIRGVCLAGVVACAGAAQAVPRHDQVQVTPIKNGGQVVGARITMVLINDHSTQFPDAYVALVSPQVRPSLTRPEAVQAALGKLAYQFPLLGNGRPPGHLGDIQLP
jgi:hypothetical protein